MKTDLAKSDIQRVEVKRRFRLPELDNHIFGVRSDLPIQNCIVIDDPFRPKEKEQL